MEEESLFLDTGHEQWKVVCAPSGWSCTHVNVRCANWTQGATNTKTKESMELGERCDGDLGRARVG